MQSARSRQFIRIPMTILSDKPEVEKMAVFAKRPVRRASAISPFGVGAIVDFPKDESLIIAGLDAWPLAKENCPPEWMVIEERMQARLRKTHFRLPPQFTNDSDNTEIRNRKIPALGFPKWHVCGFCGAMRYGPTGNRLCQSSKCQSKQRRLVPIRFVAACEAGHLTDIPWRAYVHDGEIGESQTEGHSLTFSAGTSAGTSGISISCSCGKYKNLGGLFQFSIEDGSALSRLEITCEGSRPWLDDKTGECGKHLRILQKGASNIYFPEITSAIYLPLWAENEDERIIRTLEDPKFYNLLTDQLENGKISNSVVKVIAKLAKVDAEALGHAAQRKYGGVDLTPDEAEEDFRPAEYDAIKNERGGADTELYVKKQSLKAYDPWLNEFLEGIYLIPKLRETRVLKGFSRVMPADRIEGEIAPLSQDEGIKWLPANIVQGEGIFLEFRRDRLIDYSNRSEVLERITDLEGATNRTRDARGLKPLEIHVSDVLIHTFAHLLIRQLCFDCGYGSSALRERLYTSALDCPAPLHGLLIYTSAGDSEGTLGGLVRQGEPGRLERVISSAIRSASWCSSDPVCIESVSQGTDSSNLAACHSCTLLPETSCETGNRYLDRCLVVGLPEKPEIGFFNDIAVPDL